MEIEVGEYVRTNKGYIFYIDRKERLDGLIFLDAQYGKIKKHNKIISEIVEVGDYVNGYKVEDDIEGNLRIYINNTYPSKWAYIESIKIKSIVTKEQMASIEYKVEENK